MRATDEQIAMLELLLDSNADWSEEEEDAVTAVLSELAALRGLLTSLNTLRTAWVEDRDTASQRIETAKEELLRILELANQEH